MKIIFKIYLDYLFLTAPFMLPLIGTIHLLVNSFLNKRVKTSLVAVLLILFMVTIFKPFVSLLPNLGVDSFAEAVDFDITEAIFYIKTFGYSMQSTKGLMFWIAISVLYGVLIWLMQQMLVKLGWGKAIIEKFTIFIISALIIFPVFLATNNAVGAYQQGVLIKSISKQNFEGNLSGIDVQINNHIPLNVIVYVGESVSRLHWSLYGYPRPTTDSLDKYEGKGELIKFEKIHSPHTHTSPSLLEVFSISAQDNGSLVRPRPIERRKRTSLVDVFRKGGVKTHLYNNQGTSGHWNMSSSLIFKNAYVNKSSSTKILGNADHLDKKKPFDHVFLEDFLTHVKAIPKEEKSLSVFHSYAGHGPYAQYIPISYRGIVDDFYHEISSSALFGKAKNIATIENIESYDSAMRYISDNLVQVFNEVDTINKATVVIYFSDHGESLWSGRGHDSARYVWEMSAVPFLMYFNEAAKVALEKKHMTYKRRAKLENADSLANLNSLLFDLFDAKITKNIDFKDSLNYCSFGTGNCLPDYHIIRELLDGKISYISLGGVTSDKKDIDKTDRSTAHANLVRKLLSDKRDFVVCTHGNNSIASIIRSRAVTNCLEMDIVVQEASVNIFHPPAENTGLTLSKALSAMGDRATTVWLDSKNLDKEINCNVLADEIAEENNISYFVEFPPDAINNLIELSSCMSKLKKRGAFLSYYIPTQLGIECTASGPYDSPQSFACNELEKILVVASKSGAFSDISYDYSIAPAISSIRVASTLMHNVWHIDDYQVENLSKGKYRLILPNYNDPNFQ